MGSPHFRRALLAIALLLIAGCTGKVPAPTWPTHGWPTATPEEQGMDSWQLADMLSVIQAQRLAIDSVLVARRGYLVADAYVYPFSQSRQHTVYSCTKSVVSALIGIAIDRGYIESVEQPVLELLPGQSAAHLDGDKARMSLEHLLTMSTGLDCRDSYLYGWRGLREMRQSQDWVQFVLDLPMAVPPGSTFEYCNGASLLLSAILQQATDVNALAFAQDHLFKPLGISGVTWPTNPQGVTIGYSELHMTPHDMAKIGHLYLNKGQWDGVQVVPAAWVEASTRKHIPATLQDGYGYQWWTDDSGYYMALGYAGQFIFVVPKADLVVVFTSHLEDEDFYAPQRLLDEYIIPAVRSSTSLPPDPQGVALLDSGTKALSQRPSDER